MFAYMTLWHAACTVTGSKSLDNEVYRIEVGLYLNWNYLALVYMGVVSAVV